MHVQWKKALRCNKEETSFKNFKHSCPLYYSYYTSEHPILATKYGQAKAKYSSLYWFYFYKAISKLASNAKIYWKTSGFLQKYNVFLEYDSNRSATSN